MLLAAASACNEQQAPPTEQNDSRPDLGLLSEPAYFCAETLTEVAADAPFSETQTVGNIATLLGGTHIVPIQWQSSAEGHSYGPEAETGELTLQIQVEQGAQQVVRSVGLREDVVEAPEGVGKESLGCIDTLRMTARVDVSTAGGALTETQSVPLEVLPSGIATATVSFPINALAGSFDAQFAFPEGYQASDEGRLELSFGLTGEAIAGDLEIRSGELVTADGALTSPELRERIAHFPPGNRCGVEFTTLSAQQLERRVAMAEVLERLNASSPTELQREIPQGAATSLELQFTNADTRACFPTESDVRDVLLFPALVRLTAADGSLDGEVGVDVVAIENRASIAARAGASSVDAAFRSTLVNDFAIAEEVDASGRARLAVEVEAQASSTGESSGHITVLGALDCEAQSGADPTPEVGSESDAGADPDAGTPPSECDPEPSAIWRVSWGQ